MRFSGDGPCSVLAFLGFSFPFGSGVDRVGLDSRRKGIRKRRRFRGFVVSFEFGFFLLMLQCERL